MAAVAAVAIALGGVLWNRNDRYDIVASATLHALPGHRGKEGRSWSARTAWRS